MVTFATKKCFKNTIRKFKNYPLVRAQVVTTSENRRQRSFNTQTHIHFYFKQPTNLTDMRAAVCMWACVWCGKELLNNAKKSDDDK